MGTKTYISITEFCSGHRLDTSYLLELQDYGLVTLKDNIYIEELALPRVEKIIRLQREMNINFEGIDVILNLLESIEEKEREINKLRNRLNLYE